jgi:hypothetical protein
MNKIFKNQWLPLLVILLFTPFLLSVNGGIGGGCGFLLGGLMGEAISDGKEDYYGSICGHAYLPDSDDHSGITVSLEGTSYSCITDEKGYYYISGYLDATHNLVASKSGYTNATSGPWVFPEIYFNETMTLELPGNGDATFNSVWGHVYLSDSIARRGITVSLEGTSYSCITNPRGYFYISGFPDGTYNLEASKKGYTNATSGPWEFSYTHHKNVDLKLDKFY